MSGESARILSFEAVRPKPRKSLLRRVLRIVLPTVMLGLGVYTVWIAGLQGFVALLPILAAHVVGFLVIYPPWLRFRRRREATASVVEPAQTD